MSNGPYLGIDGAVRKVTGGYIGVDNIARKIRKAYIGVDGVARLCWEPGSEAQDNIIPEGGTYYIGVTSRYRLDYTGATTTLTAGDAFPSKALSQIEIPDSVKVIGRGAFRWCSSLAGITIPAEVTEIGEEAFEKCTSLASITIPAKVTSIGDQAFYGCTALTTVTMLAETPPTIRSSTAFSPFASCDALTQIIVPAGCGAAYKAATGWSDYADIIVEKEESVLLVIMAVLVFVTNIIVEVLKVFVPKVPTNYLAIIVAVIVTVLALYIAAAALHITVMWYYAVGAVVLGIFVAYAAMFGFDKFKEALERLKVYNL